MKRENAEPIIKMKIPEREKGYSMDKRDNEGRKKRGKSVKKKNEQKKSRTMAKETDEKDYAEKKKRIEG